MLGSVLGSCAGQAEEETGPSPSPQTGAPAVAPGLTPATVTRVVDGDTIYVLVDGLERSVRYIGIDTPESDDPRETVRCFAEAATSFNRGLVEGETVGLEKDVSETDRFERLLRYVWVGNEMVNATLVGEGYAQAVTYPPDVKYDGLFAELQGDARRAERGLWGDSC